MVNGGGIRLEPMRWAARLQDVYHGHSQQKAPGVGVSVASHELRVRPAEHMMNNSFQSEEQRCDASGPKVLDFERAPNKVFAALYRRQGWQ